MARKTNVGSLVNRRTDSAQHRDGGFSTCSARLNTTKLMVTGNASLNGTLTLHLDASNDIQPRGYARSHPRLGSVERNVYRRDQRRNVHFTTGKAFPGGSIPRPISSLVAVPEASSLLVVGGGRWWCAEQPWGDGCGGYASQQLKPPANSHRQLVRSGWVRRKMQAFVCVLIPGCLLVVFPCPAIVLVGVEWLKLITNGVQQHVLVDDKEGRKQCHPAVSNMRTLGTR